MARNTDVPKLLAWFVTAFLLATSTSLAVETRFMQGLGDSHYHRIQSDIMGRPYHIFVMLPDGYDETDDY